jgi:hypothetical protein
MSQAKVIRCERCKCVIGTIISSGGGDATGLCTARAEKEAKRGGKTGPKGQEIEYVGRRSK